LSVVVKPKIGADLLQWAQRSCAPGRGKQFAAVGAIALRILMQR